MSIWFKKISPTEVNKKLKKTLSSHLEMQVTHIGDNFLEATMPMNEKTSQIHGLLHGGASCAFIETLGTIGAILCHDPKEKTAVGMQINVNHIKKVSKGSVKGWATPIHRGRSTHVWEVKLFDELTQVIAIGLITLAIIDHPQ